MGSAAGYTFKWFHLLTAALGLGIVAALNVPQQSGASTSASENTVQASLGFLRQRIDQFKEEHRGVPPHPEALWAILQSPSDPDETHTTTPHGRAAGPYFRSVPPNPWNQITRASCDTMDPSAGWYYSAGPSTYELRVRNLDGSINRRY